MITTAIFDLDGTLANTINSIAYFGNNALTKFGFKTIETERYKYLVGNGAKYLVEQMFKEIGADPDTSNEFFNVLNEYNKTYDDDFLYLTESYEGVMKMLTDLKNAGIKLGVLTNKPHDTAIKVVETLYPNTFDVVCGKKIDNPLKPDPRALDSLMKELKSTPEECVYVGDTKVDMKTGKGSNVFTIGVLWGFRDYKELDENGADIIIKEPFEVERDVFAKNIICGKYRHFKGNEYQVLDVATCSESLETVVYYKALYGASYTFVRPAKMFLQMVERDNKKEQRFTYIGE